MAHRHRTSTPEEMLDEAHTRNVRRPKIGNSASYGTISPIPIVNECSDSGGSKSKLKKVSTRKRHHHRSRRLRNPPSSAFQPLDRVNYIAENATTFAVHQSANNMHLANIVLKPQVNRLLNDNEQLNQRVNRINERNRTLSLERERLLTTIQNTAAILQSTVTSLGRESRFQLEEAPKKTKSPESTHSDFLERSTKCTIKEFDNLLNALQSSGREKRESRTAAAFDLGYGSGKSKSLSQYDIIVKWLNNETPQRSGSTNRDDYMATINTSTSSSSSSMTTSSSSSSSTSTVCQDELDKLLENAQITNERCYTLIAKDRKGTAVPVLPAPPNGPQTGTANSCDKSASSAGDGDDGDERSHGVENVKSANADREASKPAATKPERDEGEKVGMTNEVAATTTEGVENVAKESMLWLRLNAMQASPRTEHGEPIVELDADEQQSVSGRGANSRRLRRLSSVEELRSEMMSDSQMNADEHEEFISLCNTMIQRMDSMISRTDVSRDGIHLPELPLRDNNKARSPDGETTTTAVMTRTRAPMPRRRQRPHVDLRKLDRAVSTSSSLSWPDLDQMENEGDLQTVQKCLANLEIMNIRRTNQALTQTLIIKALRKLLARQFCHLARTHNKQERSADSENDFATDAGAVGGGGGGLGGGGGGSIRTETMKTPDSLASDEPGILLTNADKKTQAGRCKGGEIYQIINNVSKSIIYSDMSNEFVKLYNNADYYERRPTSTGEFVKYKQSFSSTPIATITDRRCYTKSGECRHCGIGIDISSSRKPTNQPKILAELTRLQAEEHKPIPRFWYYMSVLIVLSQLCLFRWLKNVVHLILKF